MSVVAQLRFVLERLGVYLQDGTLSQGANPYYMGVPGNYEMDLLSALFAVDAGELNSLTPLRTRHNFEWPMLSCSVLEDRAQEVVSDLELAEKKPINRWEMLKVRGIGNQKFKNYGEDFLKVINEFSEDDMESIRIENKIDNENLSFERISSLKKDLGLNISEERLKEVIIKNLFM